MKARTLVLLLLALLLSAGAVTSAKVLIGRGDWTTYTPDAPLEIHRAYKTPYTEVVWVADRITRLDGSQVFVLENIRGRFCLATLCAWPVTQGRGVLVEVSLTIAPDDPTEDR